MSDEIKVTAAIGGRPITLDPIRVIPVTVEVREVESTIPCGFQSIWGEGDTGGQEYSVTAGAGFGSRWGTIQWQGRSYCFDVMQLLNAFAAAEKLVERPVEGTPSIDADYPPSPGV